MASRWKWGGRGAVPWALVGLALYWSVLLVDIWRPEFGASPASVAYFLLSILIVLPALVGLALWGYIGTFSNRQRGSPPNVLHRSALTISLGGLLFFALAIIVSRSVDHALPTGSYLLRFEPTSWRQGDSAVSRGEFTPRQKMLGDLITRVLPGRNRSEIQDILGPATETDKFHDSGQNLIYWLGPERDSGFRIDSEWLLIWFDHSGSLQRSEVWSD